MVLFQFFGEVTNNSVTCLMARENLLRKMRFPRLVIPLAVIITALMNLGMTLVAVMIFALVSGVTPGWGWLELPLLVALLAAFAGGVGMLLSVLYVRYRDVQPIWEVVTQMLFYASPILYVATTVPDKYLDWYLANPLATILTQMRHAVVDPSAPSARDADRRLGAGADPAGDHRRRGRDRHLGLPPRGAADRGASMSTPELEVEQLRAQVAELERQLGEQAARTNADRRRGPGARVLARPLAPRPQRVDGHPARRPVPRRSCAWSRAPVRQRPHDQAPPARMTPEFSVVVPVKDGARYLAELIAAVRAQQEDVELLVIDSGSSDDSVAIARAAGAEVLEIAPEEFGHGRTRNLGAERTSGRLIAFLTQDATPLPGWLAAYREAFALSERVGAAYGPHLPRPDTSPMIARELVEFFATFSPDGEPVVQRRGDATFLANVNACYRRDCWEAIRFPDIAYSEDQAFGRAMLDAGWEKVYHPGAAVLHAHDYSAGRVHAPLLRRIPRAAPDAGPRRGLRPALQRPRRARRRGRRPPLDARARRSRRRTAAAGSRAPPSITARAGSSRRSVRGRIGSRPPCSARSRSRARSWRTSRPSTGRRRPCTCRRAGRRVYDEILRVARRRSGAAAGPGRRGCRSARRCTSRS